MTQAFRPLLIRAAVPEDSDAIWDIFHEVVSTGDTYAYAPDTGRSEALRLWIEEPQSTYVGVDDDEVVGTYCLKANQPDLGAHVCNAAYMVASRARGEGLGRAMCEHSMAEARRLGYRAMQYNLVVATNEGAIRLWEKMGFTITGTLPEAFQHAQHGFVDAVVMYRLL